jgi:hypothetical protein
MATLVQLAGSEAADIIDAPFTIIAALFALCRLWRYWAASRTYVACEVAARVGGSTRRREPGAAGSVPATASTAPVGTTSPESTSMMVATVSSMRRESRSISPAVRSILAIGVRSLQEAR